jgi:hypothetical protein
MRDKAIRNTHTNVVSINAERDAWDKDGNVVVLDESKIITEIDRLQTEYDAQEYARNRQTEYPPIADQQDMQFHDAIDGTTTWQDAIQAVKTKYPKSE